MKDNSLRKIEKIILKVLSLIIAIGLWIFISYTLNPEISKVFSNIDIEYIMPSDNSIVILNDYPETCDVTLKGKRNDIIALSKDDIKLDVDLRYVTTMDKDFKLEVKFPVKKNLTLLNQEFDVVNLELDDNAIKAVPVNFAVADLSEVEQEKIKFKMNPDYIMVSGAKSELDKIKEFCLKLNREDILDKKDEVSRKDISHKPQLELHNPETDSLNREFVKYDVEQVTLECEFLKQKTVDLVCAKEYFNSDYLEIASQKLSLDAVEIRGRLDDINSIEEIKCQPIIDQEIFEAGEYKFLVKLELPSDIKLLSDQDIYLKVKVKESLAESEL